MAEEGTAVRQRWGSRITIRDVVGGVSEQGVFGYDAGRIFAKCELAWKASRPGATAMPRFLASPHFVISVWTAHMLTRAQRVRSKHYTRWAHLSRVWKQFGM